MKIRTDIGSLWCMEKVEVADVAGIETISSYMINKVAFVGEDFKLIPQVNSEIQLTVMQINTRVPKWRGGYFRPHFYLKQKYAL